MVIDDRYPEKVIAAYNAGLIDRRQVERELMRYIMGPGWVRDTRPVTTWVLRAAAGAEQVLSRTVRRMRRWLQ